MGMYRRFGLDEGEEMWVLELVTSVSVPPQPRRRFFLFCGRQNERVVLYSRQSGADEAETGSCPGHSWTFKSPPGQDLHRPGCSTGNMPGTPRCYCTTLLFSSGWHVSCQCTTLLPSMSCSQPSTGTNCGKHRSQCQAGMA